MAPSTYARIVLAERPKEHILPDTFRREFVPFDLRPGEKQVVVQVEWFSLDPAMRGWLRDARSYVPPVKIGQVMRAQALGTVIEVGRDSKFAIGQLVRGMLGWTEYTVVKDKDLEKIDVPKQTQLLDFLGPLGGPGLTAYFGLLDVGKIKAGETLVVSGAAGAVGSVVCQIGKLKGAKVIAIAGTPEKCDWLEKDLGVDKAVNYKSPTFREDFKSTVGYLDVYFDNVGGEILDLALTRLNQKARVVLCGGISSYNSSKPRGPSSYLNLITMRARMEGFVVFDYADRYPSATAEMATWIAEGKVKRKYHVIEGLSNAPEALSLLFNGGNSGKLVVKVSAARRGISGKL